MALAQYGVDGMLRAPERIRVNAVVVPGSPETLETAGHPFYTFQF